MLLNANNAVLKRVRNSARTSDKYKAFKSEWDTVWEEIQAIPNSGELEDVVVAKRNKKRKVLKTFREYTNPKDDEGKFKGWSTCAKSDMNDLISSLNRPVTNQEKIFCFTYKQKQQGVGTKRATTPSEEGPNNDVEMWGLEGNNTQRGRSKQ